jgi:hypothetical protein
MIDAACTPQGLLARRRKRGRLPTVRHRKIVVSTMKRGFERDTSLHGSENGHRAIKSGCGSNETIRWSGMVR